MSPLVAGLAVVGFIALVAFGFWISSRVNSAVTP